MARIWSSASTPGWPSRAHVCGPAHETGSGAVHREPAADAADTRSVVAAIRRAQSRDRLRSLALAAPLLVLLALSFGIPIVHAPVAGRLRPDDRQRLAATTRRLRCELERKRHPRRCDVLEALAADLEGQSGQGQMLANLPRASMPDCPARAARCSRPPAHSTSDGTCRRMEVVKSVPFWSKPGTWATIESGTHAADVVLSPECARPSLECRRQHRTGATRAGYIPARIRAHLPRRGNGDACNAHAGISPRLSHLQRAKGPRRDTHRRGPAAVLDVDPGADRGLDGASAKIRPGQRVLLWLGVDQRPARPDVQPARPDHRHDAYPTAVHAAADLQRHAYDPAIADAGSLFARRQAVHIVPAASIFRRWCRESWRAACSPSFFASATTSRRR